MKRYGFAKSSRLLRRADFVSRRGRARKVYTRSFTVVCRENQAEGARIGIVTTKKVGNAVRRNKVRRLVREFFRLNRERIKRREDFVVIVRPGTRIDSYVDVERELEALV